MVRAITTALASLALVVPTIASAAAPVNPAASLSVSGSVRAGSTGKHANRASAAGTVAILFAIGALVGGVVAMSGNNNNSNGNPDSN